ncbi:MAG TPA: NUDIX domain-containing protein [Candidatus Saccharimonadia bacterium]|nr:NUDIX domain-containing protein [Candidatus Saccharimonadia bacterium]
MTVNEMVDILDSNGVVIASVSRVEAEAQNHTTQNVLVFIFTTEGKVWVQLRPKTKNHYPGRWDVSACGGLLSGEEPDLAATRELSEETGLSGVELHHVETFMNIFPGDAGEERRRLSHVYVGVSDEIPQANEEADDFKAWHPAELLNDIQNNIDSYIPSMATEVRIATHGYKHFFDR